MATLKQRQKAEMKALNLECETRLQGKKGPERTAEMKIIEQLKQDMQERHQRELQEDEARKAAEASNDKNKEEDGEGDDDEKSPASSQNETKEMKVTRARQRAMKKAAKEEEDKKRRQEEAAKRGPALRDMEMAKLAGELARMNLRITDIPADGNCMFSAVAHQVKVREGSQYSVQELRNKAARAIKENPALFAPFLPEGDTLDSYCAKILKSGEWGGELELRALSIALGRQIWVHRINSPTVKWGEDEGFPADTALQLTYHEHMFALGEHYNSAAPASAGE
jgi:OTU domain-containing protein 6